MRLIPIEQPNAQLKKWFDLQPHEILVEQYDKAQMAIVIKKMTQTEYEDIQLKTCLDAYETKHHRVLEALFNL